MVSFVSMFGAQKGTNCSIFNSSFNSRIVYHVFHMWASPPRRRKMLPSPLRKLHWHLSDLAAKTMGSKQANFHAIPAMPIRNWCPNFDRNSSTPNNFTEKLGFKFNLVTPPQSRRSNKSKSLGSFLGEAAFNRSRWTAARAEAGRGGPNPGKVSQGRCFLSKCCGLFTCLCLFLPRV